MFLDAVPDFLRSVRAVSITRSNLSAQECATPLVVVLVRPRLIGLPRSKPGDDGSGRNGLYVRGGPGCECDTGLTWKLRDIVVSLAAVGWALFQQHVARCGICAPCASRGSREDQCDVMMTRNLCGIESDRHGRIR
jgi:hypothetical protein